MSNIFYPEEGEREVSLKEIVEAVEGTTYEMTDYVAMNDYGYPVYYIFLKNDKYDEFLRIEVAFDNYTAYDKPMKYHEIFFYTDDGFKWCEKIIEKVNIKYNFMSGSSHSDIFGWQDDLMDYLSYIKKVLRFEDAVYENNLKFRPLPKNKKTEHEEIISFLEEIERCMDSDFIEKIYENRDKEREKILEEELKEGEKSSEPVEYTDDNNKVINDDQDLPF